MPCASPQGVKLLSYLYNEAQNNCSNENYPVLLSLLKSSCEPYTRFVSDWVYSGVFRDVYGEFMIQVNEEYLSFRDKHFWVQGYTLISKDVEDCVPVFLRHIANDVYVCGKTINLLKICCPQHYICWSELPVPRISVTFSLQEVEEIERDCAVYRGRMERIAKHSAVSREEQAQRAEQARQELINQVRESAAQTLETIRGRQVSQRLAEEAKKRERFEELKQHLEQEQEWRSAAKKKQEEDDFSFAREVRDREKRLQALEEQLEQRARKELIAQYSRLSEEAARRERRAMWRVQRMRLDEARSQFFMRDRQQTQAMLEKYPLGQQRPPVEVVPSVPSAKQTAPQSTLESSTQDSSEPQASEAQESNAASPPPESALISEDIDINDFLPKSPNPDSQQVDAALQEIGSDLPEVCPTAQLVDYDFSAPFSPLEGITGQAPAQPRPRWGPVVQPDVNQNHPSFSHITIGENVSHVQESVPKASPFGQASKSSFPLGQYTPEEPQITSKASTNGQSHISDQRVDGRASMADNGQEQVAAMIEQTTEVGNLESKVEADEGGGKSAVATREDDMVQQSGEDHQKVVTGLCDSPADTQAQNKAENVSPPSVHVSSDDLKNADAFALQPSTNIHGHSSDAHIKVGQFVSEVTAPLPSPNVHGHASDSHIKIGEHVSEVDAPPPSSSAYGHSSDAHIKVGENVSGFVAPLPVPNIHGHASDAHIKVGEHVSDVVVPLPSASVHGHSSDAHIKVGENVSDVAAPLPSPSVHGHSSDANIKVGEFVSNVPEERPRWSKYGHASDCVLQTGCVVSGSEPALPALPGGSFGHSSDSTLSIGCVVSGDEPKRSPLPGSAHGHSSDSNLDIGCVVTKAEPLPSPLPGSAYGHSSDSTLGVGCVVLGAEPQASALPGSAYGHSSDSSLGVGCVVKGKGSGNNQKTEDNEDGKGSKANSPGEQLAESIGSWAGGFGLSPGEKSEQEYLLALSAQYQVEHYEDCYSLMASSPECQLLKQVTRGPWGLPMDPTLRRATDTTAVQLSEMVSLPVLIKHSVTTPLITHVSLVNKAVVDYFFVELGVERHFEALRHFLLMEDGEFAQSLSDLLFEKVKVFKKFLLSCPRTSKVG